jgi:hypothetical protein
MKDGKIGRVAWSPLPDDDQKSLLDLELIRVKEGGQVVGICLSSELNGVLTHWQGKTQPCLGDECDCRTKKLETRFNAYIVLMLPRTGNKVIVQVSRNAAKGLRAGIKEHGKLRGMEVTLKRVGKNKNGKLVGVVCPLAFKGMELPPEPDVQAEMCRIWGIEDVTAEKIVTKGINSVHVESKRAPSKSERRGMVSVGEAMKNGRVHGGEVS